MRVLFVGTNRGGGGTESHFVSLARALARAGHDVAAAVRPDDFMHRCLSHEARVQLFGLEFRSRRDARAIRELIRIVREIRPDWIVGAFKAEYWGLTVVSKCTGAPLVLFSHLDQRVPPVMLNRLMPLARAVIVPSEFLRRRKIERGLPASRVVVLPNPIAVHYFAPDAGLRARTRASLGLSDDDLLIGYVGRFEAAKGVATLARAVNAAMIRVPRLHALWVGHGDATRALHEIAQRGDPARHHWMPWVDDIRPAYTAMDMFALPSEGSETFGRVLVEAQACGVPVLGARNGGIPEALADGETGRLIAPGNVPAWTEAIVDLATDDVLRKRFARAARPFAVRFDSGRIAADFIRVLEALEAPRSAPTPIPLPELPVTLAQKAVGD
jgi:glycosyltransferase involved in cell wall biosynthesis